MWQWILNLLHSLRFITNYRTRQAHFASLARAERDEERHHQATLIKTFLTSLETIQETSAKESSSNANALIEVAKAVSAQAAGFGEWMKCFQATSPPTSSVVREEDEYADEQLRNADKGLPADMAALPAEFQLAWALKNDPNFLGQNDPIKP